MIEAAGTRLSHVANGTVRADATWPTADRLARIFEDLSEVMTAYRPDEAAVEEAFVNRNPSSTLRLGLARGIALLVPARAGIPVGEYAANRIKKAVVGAGHADKRQVEMMVRMLLPGADPRGSDAADALAVAICHAHVRATGERWREAVPTQAEDGA